MTTFLDQWKATKKKYEDANEGKHKPGLKGKFMGFSYTKKSGIEDALRDVDIALTKKDVEDANSAMNRFKATVNAWSPETFNEMEDVGAVTKGKVKVNGKDAEDLDGKVIILHSGLIEIAKKIQTQLDNLTIDPKAIMTVAQAIGPKAMKALKGLNTLTDKSVLAWLDAKSAGEVMIGNKKFQSAASAKCVNNAKAAFAKFKKICTNPLYLDLQAKMERNKGVGLIEILRDEYIKYDIDPTSDLCWRCHIAHWSHAQQDEFVARIKSDLDEKLLKQMNSAELQKHNDNLKKQRTTALENWQKSSDAWKAGSQLADQLTSQSELLSELDEQLQTCMQKPWPIREEIIQRHRGRPNVLEK